MFYKVKPLPVKTIEALKELQKEVPMKHSLNSYVRIGTNRANRLSYYNYSKWFTWKAKQRKLVKDLIGPLVTEDALQVWFQEYPPKIGFLDEMDYWTTRFTYTSVVVYNLGKTACILIDKKPVSVDHGHGISFSLTELHEIKESADGQLWFCVMVGRDPKDYAI